MMKIDNPFVQKFADYWAAPNAEGVSELVHDDAVFVQPLCKPLLTDQYHDYVKCVLKVTPGIHGKVLRYAECQDSGAIFIHWVLNFYIGSALKEVGVVDVIHLRDGKVAERTAYMDLIPLLGSIIARPLVWFRWLRFLVETNRL